MLRAEKKLQMPPLLPERKEINFVFVDDPKLVGLSESKFVFTDISFGTTDRTRTIVVRDPDGKLRKATWDERARMNSLLEREEYEFVLDRACLQFEPDDPKFIHTCKLVFDSVNETSSFSVLRSTRHYGSLIFHLVEKENIDDLLIENMKTDRLEDATWLITLYHIIHPSTKSKSFAYSPGKELDLIKVLVM
ncbi:hypothetical protein AAG570_005233 [Ranatra chinensis]|uniref:Uncharacterized protein n=1 Tax=Ranatra chinensis TaxID=642074 RepID=A0ABD0XZW8_9HEMI